MTDDQIPPHRISERVGYEERRTEGGGVYGVLTIDLPDLGLVAPEADHEPGVTHDDPVDRAALYEQAAELVRRMVTEAGKVSAAAGRSKYTPAPSTPADWHEQTLAVARFLAGER